MGTRTGNGMTRTQDMDLSASGSVSELSTGNDGDGIYDGNSVPVSQW